MRGFSQEKYNFLRRHITWSSVIGFSETHAKLELINSLFGANWTVINSTFTNASAGVLLAIRSEIRVTASGFTNDGRCAWADLSDIRILAVYLPNTSMERSSFLLNTLQPLVMNKKAIVIGDFNTVLYPSDKVTPFQLTKDIIILRDFLNLCNLVDAATKPQYTFKSGLGNLSRIDYCFVEESLSPNVCVDTIVLPRPFDHAALRIYWRSESRTPRWILNTNWLTPLKQSILELISQLTVSSSAWDNFKLKVKKMVQSISKGSTTKLNERFVELNDKLSELWENDPNKHYAEVSQEIFRIELMRAESLALKTRSNFDKFTLAPSKVFTSLLKKRIIENTISLKHGNDVTDDPSVVGSILANHWNGIHCEKNVYFDPVFTSQIPKAPFTIDGPITPQEVIQVIDKLRSNSSPGVDGFVPGFYKLFKNELSGYLAHLFNLILDGKQRSPRDFKTAIIRFIGKKGADLASPKGWRPISLLNFDFKILTGVLAMRLQSVLADMTSNIAYIKARFIIQNVLDLDAFFKLDLEGQLVFLSDFFNAFDTLNHRWIEFVLENAGLGIGFVNAVRYLLKDMFAFPIVGSTPTGHKINLKAGVRQGDPLSGLLFVLCIEPLIRAAKAICVKVLAYADDLCFIARDQNQIAELIKLVKNFEKASGLKLNTAKSKLIDIANPEHAGLIEGISFASSFEYLGYSFNGGGIDNYILIRKLDGIVENLNSLKRLNLSIPQKVTVLNCYVFSGLFYFLWATSPSNLFYKACDKVMRWFLENSKFSFDPSRQYPLHMALDIYKRPKSRGGFGLVCVKSKALAFKWKLFNRYRTINCPFSMLLHSLLKVSRKRPGLVLRDAKKVPTLAKGYARDLIQVSLLLKPSFQATDLSEVFTDTQISLPHVPGIGCSSFPNDSTTKEITLRLLNAEHDFTLLREEQKKICSLVQVNWDTVWKQMLSLKGYRTSVLSFLYRMLNAGLWLPSSCPLCRQNVSCSTLHFLQCPIITDTINVLSPNAGSFDFFKSPRDATKSSPRLPLVLFSCYSVLMQLYFDGDTHVDYIPRVKIRLGEEVLRKDIAFQ